MSRPTWRDSDIRFMRLACRLASKAAGRTSPNPMVGAVLVRRGKIISAGYHQAAGSDHAEIVALKRAGVKARGATLYINLEPCSHFGRTPPCSRALIGAGIKTVFAGMVDPNPLVSGRGLRELRRAGISVNTGLLAKQCRAVNEAFVKYMTRGLPFVTLKLAASLDGKIATRAGDSRWISSERSRRWVHRLRNQMDAVLVGSETVMIDDPELTCRLAGGRNPWRVVLSRRLRVSSRAQLFRLRDPEKTVVITSRRAPAARVRAIEERGAKVFRLAERNGKIPWTALLRKLATIGVQSVLVEGGAITAASALKARAVDKILFFYAPRIIGGDGRSMIDCLGFRSVKESLKVDPFVTARSGGDLVISAYLSEKR